MRIVTLAPNSVIWERFRPFGQLPRLRAASNREGRHVRRNTAVLMGVALAGAVTLAACGSGGSSAQNLHNVQQLAGKRSDINPRDPATLVDGNFVWPLDAWLPNWNGNEVDGNDENDVPVYSAIEPELFTIESDGTTQPNPDYLTSAKVTSTSPQVITLDFNPKAHWTDGSPLSWQTSHPDAVQ